jgi:hypothetical protein
MGVDVLPVKKIIFSQIVPESPPTFTLKLIKKDVKNENA